MTRAKPTVAELIAGKGKGQLTDIFVLYRADVESGVYPAAEHKLKIGGAELAQFIAALDTDEHGHDAATPTRGVPWTETAKPTT